MVASSELSRFPVVQGDLDNVIGTVRAKRTPHLESAERTFYRFAEQAVFVPETMHAFQVLEVFRQVRLRRWRSSSTSTAARRGSSRPDDVLVAIVGSLPSSEGGAPSRSRAFKTVVVDRRDATVDELRICSNLKTPCPTSTRATGASAGS